MKKEEEDKWTIFEGKQQKFTIVGDAKFFHSLPRAAKPIDYFNKYLSNDIIDVMVTETNRNARQVIEKSRLNRSSRLRAWVPTNPEEIRKFLGLLLWMALHSLPRITDYWTNNYLQKQCCPHHHVKKSFPAASATVAL